MAPSGGSTDIKRGTEKGRWFAFFSLLSLSFSLLLLLISLLMSGQVLQVSNMDLGPVDLQESSKFQLQNCWNTNPWELATQCETAIVSQFQLLRHLALQTKQLLSAETCRYEIAVIKQLSHIV